MNAPAIDRKRERGTFLRLIWASSLLFAAVLCLHNVAKVHGGNSGGFQFALHQIFYVTGPVFLVISAYLIVPAFWLHEIRLRIYAFALSYVAVLAWIYSNFVVLDFGLLDGKLWDFEPLSRYLYPEIAALIAAGVALWFVLNRLPRACLYFLAILNVGLVGPSVYALMTDSKDTSLAERPNLDAAYRFSRQQNVLIVLMDAFQSDLFAELLEKHPDLPESLRGFTFFPNTTGVARTTFLTMPAIHSGARYSPRFTMREIYDRQIRQGSFLNALAEAGHEVTMVNPMERICPAGIELCIDGNEILHGKVPNLVMEAAYLLDLSLFRAAPMFAKETLYNEQYWAVIPRARRLTVLVGQQEDRTVEENRVLEVLAARGTLTDRPVTKFIHLLNTHWPYVLGSDCRVGDGNLSGVRDRARVQAHCGLKAFLGLMDFLRREEIYDRSLIFLIADTGADLASQYTQADEAANGWRRLVGRANPLFLVKPPGARQVFNAVETGIQPSDLAATVCAFVAGCDVGEGLSVFEAQAMAPRARVYKDYRWSHQYWGKDVVPESYDYTVVGPIWDRDSWVNF